MATTPRIIVHLVHGTWPYGRGKKARERWQERQRSTPDPKPLWFMKGSDFCKDIERYAERPIEFITFEWSGENSFRDRHEAATILGKHLEESLQSAPDAYHVVVAHSHGGTIAFEAIANSQHNEQRSIAALLTMGTPFVTLRKSPENSAEGVARAAALRWGQVLMLCFIMALAGALAIGGSDWFGATLALLLGIVISLMLIIGKTGAGWIIRDTSDLPTLLAGTTPELPCPLIAYRTPGDEASLAISAAQSTDLLFGRIWGWLIVRPLAYYNSITTRLGAWLSIIAYWTMTSIAVISYDLISAATLRPPWIYLLAGPWYAGIFLALVFLALVIVVPMVLLPGIVALRLATGPEVFRYAGYISIDAEPVPVGVAANIEMLTLSDDERSTMALRHSLHGLDITRQRIGVWLQKHCK